MNDAHLAAVATVLALQGVVWLRRIERWPLSAYPMYSNPWRVRDVVVFRAQVETAAGAVGWWCPRYEKEKQELSIRLNLLLRGPGDPAARRAGVVALLRDVVVRDLVAHRPDEPVVAVHLVRRTYDPEVGVVDERVFSVAVGGGAEGRT